LVVLIFADNDFTKVRAVNLGGWLVVEGWIKPSLFDGIPNGDMLVGSQSELMLCTVLHVYILVMWRLVLLQDGTQVQLKSVGLHKYVSAGGGGGGSVTVDRDVASSWETFKVNFLSEVFIDEEK
jgi:hypothetical protein